VPPKIRSFRLPPRIVGLLTPRNLQARHFDTTNSHQDARRRAVHLSNRRPVMAPRVQPRVVIAATDKEFGRQDRSQPQSQIADQQNVQHFALGTSERVE
jgi:hypothetical protein